MSAAPALHTVTLPDANGPDPLPDGTITWIGNATVLVEVAGFRVLTDPNFLHQGDHAALGGGLRSKRLHDPAAELTDLLPVDLVVLSHHHGDHWDEVADRDVPKDLPIVTTRHAAKKLGRSGFRNTYALDTWQVASVVRGERRLTITALPAKHAPQPLQSLLPPVMGSMLDVADGAKRYRIYITGDTLFHDRLSEIADRYSGIDLALIHLGGTRVLGVLLTMDGEQGAKALEVIDADVAIPIHYEEYTVMKSPLSDFDAAVARRDVRTRSTASDEVRPTPSHPRSLTERRARRPAHLRRCRGRGARVARLTGYRPHRGGAGAGRNASRAPPECVATGMGEGLGVMDPVSRPVTGPQLEHGQLEDLGIEVDHVTLYRWVQRFTPLLVEQPGRAVTRSVTGGSSMRPT